jgi:hypothetical protein
MPGDSGQDLDIVAGTGSGVRFGVADLRESAGVLSKLGLQVKSAPQALTVTDPDGVVITFVKK